MGAARADPCAASGASRARGAQLLETGDRLLAAVHFSISEGLACDAAAAQEAQFGFLLSLFRLGEQLQFEQQWWRITAGVAPEELRKVRLLGARAYGLGTVTDPDDAARLAVWSARFEDGQFTGALERWRSPAAADVLRAHGALRSADRRVPWLAGLLSAALPGLGQAYVGSWQSAAVAFVVNALFIGATVELFWHRLWFAGAAGAALVSVTYVGNIVNAAQSAQTFNASRRRAPETALERALFPELFLTP